MDKYYNHTEELRNQKELEARNSVLLLTLASSMVGDNANVSLTILSLGNVIIDHIIIM